MKSDNLSVHSVETNDIVILNLKGYLDAHTASQLESNFEELLQNNKYKIIVNFKELDYISSAGLGIFMAFIEEVRENKGDIKLCEMQQKVFSVFDLLGFPILFDIEKTNADAIEKFDKGDLRKNES